MTDYSKYDQLELAQQKLNHFNSFLSALLHSRKKLKEAVEQDKHQYYDNPPYVWSIFRKYLAENHLQISESSFFVGQLQEFVSLADECIFKYSKLFAIPEKKLKSIFINYPLADANIDYNKFSFKINIEFCVKVSDYIHRLLKSINKDLQEIEQAASKPMKSHSINEKPDASSLNGPQNASENNNMVGNSPKQETEIRFIGDKELADYLGKSLTTIWRYKKAGKFTCYDMGRQYYYKKEEIDQKFKRPASENNKGK